ncbi:MAG: hypothetical protein ACXWLI_08565, partial [Myxococcaceae bacterium]
MHLPGGRLERAIESRVLMAIVDVLVLLESGLFGRTGLVRRLSEGIALGVGPVAVHAAALAAAGMYVFSLPGSATPGEAVLLALVLLLVGFEEE